MIKWFLNLSTLAKVSTGTFFLGILTCVSISGTTIHFKMGETELKINELQADLLDEKFTAAGLARVLQCSNGAVCE